MTDKVDDKQSVASPTEGQEQNAPASEAQGAPETTDWDAILAKYRDGVPGREDSSQQQTTQTESDTSESSNQTRDPRVDELYEREVRADVGRAVDYVKGELDVDRDLVEGYVNSRAAKQPEISKAFENRYKDPSGWQSVLEGLKSDYQRVIQKLTGGGNVDADKQAVVAALNASRSGEPSQEADVPKNLGTMSNAEFEAFKAGLR